MTGTFAAAARGRILILDIETSPALARVWRLFDENIGIKQIEEATEVLCFAAKWHGERKVHYWSQHHDGHEAMVDAAWQMMDDATAIVGYNSRGFDVKHLHREFVLAGMAPPSPHRDIDLLTVARQRFKFMSNKLEHVASELGLGHKLTHTGYDLWRRCMAGDEAAWRTMRRYNIQDVRLTEAVYDRLRPWIKSHPHPGLHGGALDGCPICGGRLEPAEPIATTVALYEGYRCVECGAPARGARSIATTKTRGT